MSSPGLTHHVQLLKTKYHIFDSIFFKVITFFSSAAELNVELSRPLKINPTLAKLEQAKAFLRKVFPEAGDRLDPGRAPSAQSSPGKPASPRASAPSSPSRTWGHAGPLQALQPFHKVSLSTVQIVVAMETDTHPSRPSLTVSVSGMKGSLIMRHGPKLAGQSEHTHTHTDRRTHTDSQTRRAYTIT